MKPIQYLARGLALASLVALLALAAVTAQRRARSTPAPPPASHAPAASRPVLIPGPATESQPVFLFGSKSGPLQVAPRSRPAFLPSSKFGALPELLVAPASRPDHQ